MLSAPEEEKTFNYWREQVVHKIYEVEFIIKELYPTLDEKGRELFNQLRLKLELYRASLVMTKAKNLRDFSEEASAVWTVCNETLAWRENHREALKSRIEDFATDVRGLFDRMKGTVGDFLK